MSAKTKNIGAGSSVMNQALKLSGTLGDLGAPNATLEITGSVVVKGEIAVSGSLYARQRHVHSHKYNQGSSNSDQKYLRFDTTSCDASPGVNNKFIAPASGYLKECYFRSTIAAGSTSVSLHKSSNGTANLNTTATKSITVDCQTADTTYEFEFDAVAQFGMGDIVGLSADPTNGPGDVNVVSVWEFFWESHEEEEEGP